MIVKFAKILTIRLILRYSHYLLRGVKSSSPNFNVGITTVIHHKNVNIGICTLLSFFYWSEIKIPVCIFDDGSLTKSDKIKINNCFSAIFISNVSAEKKIKLLYQKHKNFIKYRLDKLNPPTKRKFDAVLLSPFKKTIYIEPDVMFYKKPDEILRWVTDINSRVLYMTHDRKELNSETREDLDYSFRHFAGLNGYKFASYSFNSGILCIPNPEIIDLNYLDKIFKVFNKTYYSRTFCSEESAYSLLLYQKGKSLSSTKYSCPTLANEYRKSVSKKPTAIHYIGNAKQYLERDMTKLLLKTLFFHN